MNALILLPKKIAVTLKQNSDILVHFPTKLDNVNEVSLCLQI